MSIERLIAKVAHLRALAAKAGTREEAETAARLADEIMQKHRIDAAEVEARGVAAIDDDMIEDPTLYQGGRSAERWIGNLAATVAKHYGCYVFRTRRPSDFRLSLSITGRKSDVEIARYMFAWCHVEIARLSLLETGKAARNGFRHGAVAGLRGALYASTKAAQVGHGSAALVLASRVALSKEFAEKATGRKFRKDRSSSFQDRDAYTRGQAAGSRLSARNRPLPAASGRLLGSSK